jgi:hypothetical protein
MNGRTISLTYSPVDGNLTADPPHTLADDWRAFSINGAPDGSGFPLSRDHLWKTLEHASKVPSGTGTEYMTMIPVTIRVLVTEAEGNVVTSFRLTELIRRPDIKPEPGQRSKKKRSVGGFPVQPKNFFLR